jgi:hypothetical protein
MPNNESAKEAAGIVAVNSLQSSANNQTTVISVGLGGDSSGNFASKTAWGASDISSIKSTLTASTVLESSSSPVATLIGDEPYTDAGLIEIFLRSNYASDYAAGKFSYDGQVSQIASAMETLRNTPIAKTAIDFTDYMASFRAGYSGPVGPVTFNFAAPQSLSCIGSGNSCGSGSSATLNSQSTILNLSTNVISNAYNVSYIIGGAGSGVSATTGSYVSAGEVANMASLQAVSPGSKIFYLPINASHTMLKMLATFSQPSISTGSTVGVFNTVIQKQIGTSGSIMMSSGNYSATQPVK